ncbi:MAG: DUF1080 domain-containing protein [Planctomycetaceae bacterium]|jgi:hypothetical protein|nr:DUF1080 domain-containing protein [Planctomycetaceae bacterium]
MKRTVSVFFCFVLTSAFLFAEENAPNTLSPQEQAEGFQLLFDGKILPPDIWQSAVAGYPVEDGVVVCRKGGNLLTAKEYGDFVFRFEFALPPGGNNGVGIRAESPDKDAAYYGMEVQILDNTSPKYAKLEDAQYHGSIYKVAASKRNAEKNDYLKPVGEWNTEEIIAAGSRITVILNGEIIVDKDIAGIDLPSHPGLHREKGFVGFLGHGDPVKFRNIRIKELNTLTGQEQKEGFTLLFDGKTLSPELWNGDIKGYRVENDVLVCRGGNILTKKEYGDFTFRFEFKLPPGGNNGVGFRCPAGGGSFDGFEIQILDHFDKKYKNKDGSFWLQPYQYHGSIYGTIPANRYPDKNDYQKPVGQWNYEEVSLKGSQIKVVLNGGVLVDANLDDYKDKDLKDHRPKGLDRKSGFVGFLGHSDPVEFRNVRIK